MTTRIKAKGIWSLREEENGVALWECIDGPEEGRWAVTGIDHFHHQVSSLLPSDMPADGGQWVAGIGSFGVEYVTHGRSKAAARRQYLKHVRGFPMDEEN